MKNLILFLIVVLLAGCAGTFQPSGSCVEGDSYILSTTKGNPSGLDKTLLAVNFLAMENGTYTAEQAEQALIDIQEVVENGISYAGLFKYLNTRYAAAAVIILGADINQIVDAGQTQILSTCDKELILSHITHQRGIVALYQ